MDNLSDYKNLGEQRFRVGDIVPNWENYKYHGCRVAITTSSTGITHDQISLFGASVIRYNMNTHDGGSVSLAVLNDGTVSYSGSYPYNEIFITEVFMFN